MRNIENYAYAQAEIMDVGAPLSVEYVRNSINSAFDGEFGGEQAALIAKVQKRAAARAEGRPFENDEEEDDVIEYGLIEHVRSRAADHPDWWEKALLQLLPSYFA